MNHLISHYKLKMGRDPLLQCDKGWGGGVSPQIELAVGDQDFFYHLISHYKLEIGRDPPPLLFDLIARGLSKFFQLPDLTL